MQLSHFHLGACHRQKKEQRRFSFQPPHLSGSLPPQKRQEYPALQLSHFHLGACHRKKGKEGLVFNCHAHLEPATAKTSSISSLAAVTFSLGSLPPQKKGQEGSAGSLPPQKNQEYPACSCHIFTWEPATAEKKVKKFQFATVTLIWAPATRKREQMCSLQVSHSHLGACHRLNVKNIQFAAVTFSPGGLPPPKKKVKKVSFQLSTTTVIWESATTKNEQMCSLQVYHLGACHQKMSNPDGKTEGGID